MSRFAFSLALLALLVPVACASSADPTSTPPGKLLTSGISGAALVGPVSPVERPGVANERPLPGAVITVQPANGGQEIARATAGRDGRFKIPLRPGIYRIVPLPPIRGAVLPHGISRQATVRTGFTQVTVHYDSGIR